MDITKKILIVDDRPENLVALEKLLEDFDIKIVKAFSGNEALTKTLEHEFALALIDVQMPDMDGYETVKLMRQVDHTRFLPVIFLSAIYSENHYLIQGIEAGAVDFITKPIQPRILLGKVRILLDLYEQKKMLELEIEQRKLTEASLLQTEKELLEAKVKAEEADMLKSAFLANMSHEIRTPLNAIVGFANLLAEEGISPDKKEQYLDYIFNSSETLTNIISDILDIAKIEAGQMIFKPSPINLDSILTELLATFKEELKKKDKESIEMRLTLPDTPMESLIIADPNRLKQIISNLLQNALKFTLEGTIEFGYQILDKKIIEFFVKDSGVGIAKDKLNLVFDRFQKIDNDSVPNRSGTGLGLSIVKKIIEMFGGQIWVTSELNVGTVFSFTIPLNVSAEHTLVQEKIAPPLPDNFNWSNNSILIAEDEYSNYLLLEEILESTMINITWARNGKEAIEAYQQNDAIDIVLMDIKMPVMSGIEAYRELRRLSKNLPIVAQTAYAMTDEREQLQQMGFNGYLTKPLSKKELLLKIDSFLK